MDARRGRLAASAFSAGSDSRRSPGNCVRRRVLPGFHRRERRGLRGARVVSRDLAGGVYVRWTGPFTTRVVWVEAYRKRKGLEVEAGGSKLGSVPLELLPIGYNSGTIDYLPASRHMLELRNDQGAVLWTRLVTTDDSLGPPSPPPG